MNVVRFRPSNTTAFSEKRAHASSSNIYELLDLSRYELSDRSRNEADSQKDGPDDFEHRMRANVAALIFLVALVGWSGWRLPMFSSSRLTSRDRAESKGGKQSLMGPGVTLVEAARS
jgi:hypothetical protein